MEHCCTLVSIVTAFDSFICFINSVFFPERGNKSNLSDDLHMVVYTVCVCFWNWWLLLHLVFWCSVLSVRDDLFFFGLCVLSLRGAMLILSESVLILSDVSKRHCSWWLGRQKERLLGVAAIISDSVLGVAWSCFAPWHDWPHHLPKAQKQNLQERMRGICLK